MKLQDLGSLGELTAAIAQATTASRTSWYDLVISDPEVGDIWGKGVTRPDLLTEQERSRFIWMLARIYSNLEEFHLQFKHCMLPEDQWLVYRKFGRTMLENTFIADWWNSGMAVFTPSFVTDLVPESQRAEWTADSAHGVHPNQKEGGNA